MGLAISLDFRNSFSGAAPGGDLVQAFNSRGRVTAMSSPQPRSRCDQSSGMDSRASAAVGSGGLFAESPTADPER